MTEMYMPGDPPDYQELLRVATSALVRIRGRHVSANKRAGRPIEQSRTIAICDAALNEIREGGVYVDTSY